MNLLTHTHSTAIAIIIGSLMVAGSIIYTNQANQPTVGSSSPERDKNIAVVPDGSPKREENRALYGSPDAPVTIVEFSDYECPFCSRLHPTLKQIVDESEGQINWEYRHLPLPSHRNAELAAVIGECVYKEAGNMAFWNYSDGIFGASSRLTPDQYRGLARTEGLSVEQLDACLTDQDILAQITKDVATAQAFGGSGTPFNVIEFADGTTQTVSGALPYQHWMSILN